MFRFILYLLSLVAYVLLFSLIFPNREKWFYMAAGFLGGLICYIVILVPVP